MGSKPGIAIQAGCCPASQAGDRATVAVRIRSLFVIDLCSCESGGSRALARPVLPKHPRLTPHSVRARELRSRPPSKRSSTRPCASLSSVRKARGELRTESEGTLLPRPLGLLKAAPAERSRGPPTRVRRWLPAGATTRRLLAGAP